MCNFGEPILYRLETVVGCLLQAQNLLVAQHHTFPSGLAENVFLSRWYHYLCFQDNRPLSRNAETKDFARLTSDPVQG